MLPAPQSCSPPALPLSLMVSPYHCTGGTATLGNKEQSFFVLQLGPGGVKSISSLWVHRQRSGRRQVSQQCKHRLFHPAASHPVTITTSSEEQGKAAPSSPRHREPGGRHARLPSTLGPPRRALTYNSRASFFPLGNLLSFCSQLLKGMLLLTRSSQEMKHLGAAPSPLLSKLVPGPYNNSPLFRLSQIFILPQATAFPAFQIRLELLTSGRVRMGLGQGSHLPALQTSQLKWRLPLWWCSSPGR